MPDEPGSVMRAAWAPVLAALLALVLVPLARAGARWIGAIDHPGPISVHQTPTARTGGVAIWLAAIIPLLAVWFESGNSPEAAPLWIAMIFGMTVICWLGLWDDMKRIAPWPKLALMALAALATARCGWMFWVTGSFTVDLLLSTFAIVFFVNAFNALDGLDGLAAGVGALGFVLLGTYFLRAGDHLSATVAWCLGSATLGFLAYNFPPSRGIFLGDSGSLSLGFALAVLGIRAVQLRQGSIVGAQTPWVPVGFVIVPLADALITFSRRVMRGESPLRGDRTHVYDALYRRCGSMRFVAAVYYAAAAAFGLAALWAGG